MKGLEVVEKVRETGGIRIIIGDILYLFAYIACPLFLIPLEFWSQPQIDYTVTSFGVALHMITNDLEYSYWKEKFSEASQNKLNFGG